MDTAEPTIVKSEPATREAMEELAMLTEKMSIDKKNKRRTKKSADMDMDDGATPKI